MDRGYLDFERLYRLHQADSFFVTRAKSNFTCMTRNAPPSLPLPDTAPQNSGFPPLLQDATVRDQG